MEPKEAEVDPTKIKEPSLRYAAEARCKAFAPNPQADEIPKISCGKINSKLLGIKTSLKEMTKPSKNLDDSPNPSPSMAKSRMSKPQLTQTSVQ